jgi:hypothetical protein
MTATQTWADLLSDRRLADSWAQRLSDEVLADHLDRAARESHRSAIDRDALMREAAFRLRLMLRPEAMQAELAQPKDLRQIERCLDRIADLLEDQNRLMAPRWTG